MLKSLLTAIKNIVRVGTISTQTVDDSQPRQILRVSTFENQHNVFATYPYGLSANAPDQSSQVACWGINGSNANIIGMPINSRLRFRDLKSGEVQIGNYLTRSNTKYEANNDITVTSTGNLFENVSQDITITASGKMTSNITGNVEVNAQGEVKITSPSKITLQVGGATVVLTSSVLTSSVPIQAPSYSGSGGGAANMTSGINMTGQSITNAGAVVTSGGVNLNTHIHSTPSGNSGQPIN